MRSAAEPVTALIAAEYGPAGSRRLSSRGDARGKRQHLRPSLPGLSARGRDPAPRIGTARHRSVMTTCPTPGSSASTSTGNCYSSVRISVLTSEWRISRSAEVFADILHPRLDRGEDHHRSDPLRRRSRQGQALFPELPYVTLRLAYMACEHFNADIGLAIVRAEHQAFYRRVFLHETIAEAAFVPGPAANRSALMAADFPAMREKVFARYPIMRSTAFERRMLFERSGEPAFPASADRILPSSAPRSCAQS